MTSTSALGRARAVPPLLAAALALGSLPAAQAHTYQLALGAAAGANHYFGVICSTDGGYETDHLLIQVQTLTAKAPLVSVQAVKGSAAASTTDAVSGDAAYSPPLRLRGGNGLYQVLVNKTGEGALTFNITAHCLDASGTQHTGTDALVYQYQDQ